MSYPCLPACRFMPRNMLPNFYFLDILVTRAQNFNINQLFFWPSLGAIMYTGCMYTIYDTCSSGLCSRIYLRFFDKLKLNLPNGKFIFLVCCLKQMAYFLLKILLSNSCLLYKSAYCSSVYR